MYTNEKLRLSIFLFLTFCVFSSKNIIIYNEETLVALSFFSFIFFIFHYFGNTIKESLNERSQVIQQEFSNFLDIKSLSFQELLKQRQKISALVDTLKVLDQFTKNQLHGLNNTAPHIVHTLFAQQIQQRLKTVGTSKLMLQQKLQYLLAENILWNVLLSSHSSKQQQAKNGLKSQGFQQKIMKNALDLLVANAKTK
jgi:hypothetical protein